MGTLVGDAITVVFVGAYFAVVGMSAEITFFTQLLTLLPFYVATISGAVLLPVISRRSRDVTLRSHLKWFGFFALILALGFVIGPFFADQPTGTVGFGVVVFSGGYCLYRSARSLAPLNPLP